MNHEQRKCSFAFPTHIRYFGNSLADAVKYITEEGCVFNMFPQKLVKELKYEKPNIIKIIQHVLEKHGGGFALLGKALVATLNIPCFNGVPANLEIDVIILSKKHCPFLFSFCDKTNEKIQEYNSELALNAKRLMRRFTDKAFTFIFSVLQRKDIDSIETFDNFLENRREIQFQRCFPSYILMRDDKYNDLCQAVAMCIARIGIHKTDKSDFNGTFQLLMKHQLSTVTDNVDYPETSSTLQCDRTCKEELTVRLKRVSANMPIKNDTDTEIENLCPPNQSMRKSEEVMSQKAESESKSFTKSTKFQLDSQNKSVTSDKKSGIPESLKSISSRTRLRTNSPADVVIV